MKEKIAKLQEIIDKSNNVVFFGGACVLVFLLGWGGCVGVVFFVCFRGIF